MAHRPKLEKNEHKLILTSRFTKIQPGQYYILFHLVDIALWSSKLLQASALVVYQSDSTLVVLL